MLLSLPRRHVHPGLADHLESSVGVTPSTRGPLDRYNWVRSLWFDAAAAHQTRTDVLIALSGHCLVFPVQVKCLGQLEEVLRPPVALKRLSYGPLISLGLVVAQLGQLGVPQPRWRR